MRLPWKGGRFALIVEAARDRRLRFFFCCLATLGSVGFSFFNPQVVRYTIDSVIGEEALDAPAFVQNFVNFLGGIDVVKNNICRILSVIFGWFGRECVACIYLSIDFIKT